MPIRGKLSRVAPNQTIITAALVQSIIDMTNNVRGLRGDEKTIAVDETDGVWTIRALQQPTPPGTVANVYVVNRQTADGDGILCYTPIIAEDGTITNGSQVTIAKPWLLRRTPFDGKPARNGTSYVYSTATQRVASFTYKTNPLTITERITPDYFSGDLIWAITVPNTLAKDEDSNPITLLDINVDGRAWGEGET